MGHSVEVIDSWLPVLTERTVFDVSLMGWLTWLGLTAALATALFTVKVLLRRFYASAAERTGRVGLRALVAISGATHRIFILGLSAAAADSLLGLPPGVDPFFKGLLMVVVLFQGGRWAMAVIELLLDHYKANNEGTRSTAVAAIPGIRVIASLLVWTLVGLVTLDQFGVDVTALIAGLGIGGIAVALAIQKALGDVLAYVSIVADEPFQPGDFLNVGDYLGNVETIGLRSTRLRSLSGEQIIFPNSDMLTSRIRNFGRMQTRRVVFGFGVVYQTPADVLERISTLLREIIESTDGVRFDRAHFKAYGESSLDFEVVYHVLSPDFNRYMDLQQGINLTLMRRLGGMGVEFAYPTRTLFIEKTEADDPDSVQALDDV